VIAEAGAAQAALATAPPAQAADAAAPGQAPAPAPAGEAEPAAAAAGPPSGFKKEVEDDANLIFQQARPRHTQPRRPSWGACCCTGLACFAYQQG